MDCSQTLPGAVNLGPCSAATGYLHDIPFICYASGPNLVLLDGRLKHVQTILGADYGYRNTVVTCMHIAESNGKVVAAWGCDVMVFVPEKSESTLHHEFNWSWKPSYSHSFPSKVLSLSFNQDGGNLLVSGNFISLWTTRGQTTPLLPQRESSPNFTVGGNLPSINEGKEEEERGREEREEEGKGIREWGGASWKETWSVTVASPVSHLKFSPDGSMFASASLNDRLVKIWYRTHVRREKYYLPSRGPDSVFKQFSFTYIAHPRAITGFVWRKTSVYMKQSAVSNVLLTRCKDNICRLWSLTLPREKAPQSNLLRFFLATSIDPVADIPFRSTMPVEDADFIVHWLNNKEMTYSSKANYINQSEGLTRHVSEASIGSSVNEEMLASWVCVEEKSSDAEIEEEPSRYQSYSLGDYLAKPRSGGGGANRESPSGGGGGGGAGAGGILSKRHEKHLLEEWTNSPDLLVCIHPNNGSLMVWTVEGLDSPKYSTSLVHISFSSCLPHVFPPHLAQTLHQELQQYLLKDPEPIGLLSAPLSPMSPERSLFNASNMNSSELSLPVPQIRLPSGQKVVDVPESSKTFRPESSLILLSTHRNGNVNAWSVELTVQANFCTSISGLIHCGQTGGHSKEIQSVHRHPWLPILMTIAIDDDNTTDNELIIWNANLVGPLDHKASINELSQILSSEPHSFTLASWVPPISLASSSVGALSRCPSFGLFVTNVGNELCLFQTSLYPIIPPNSSHTLYHTSCPLYEDSNKTITITSHSGNEGMSFITLIDDDLHKYEDIIALHAFRMSSVAIDAHVTPPINIRTSPINVKTTPTIVETPPTTEEAPSSDLSNEVLIVMIENRKVSGGSIIQSCLHVWRVMLQEREYTQPPKVTSSLDPWYQPASRSTYLCHAEVSKVISGELFPLSDGHIIESQPSCDVSSSLQLQLPSLFSPYLFMTVSSNNETQCWQFKAINNHDTFSLDLYDVFNLNLAKTLNFTKHKSFKDISLSNSFPISLSCAYPGRFAMAHSLTKPLKPLQSFNPLAKHVMVSVWECESTGGLQWTCESILPLHGTGAITTNRSNSTSDLVHLDWLPMENGSYLLATCFSSIISIFGMALPVVPSTATQPQTKMNSRTFSKSFSVPVLLSEKAFSSWVCLLHFPLTRQYTGSSLNTRWMVYTGSNSIAIGIGSEMEVYTCWVDASKMATTMGLKYTPLNKRKLISRDNYREGFNEYINLLDYAHSKNSPLPQYHPRILTDLLSSGKLGAVKLILSNLVKYLLLYEIKGGPLKKTEQSYMMDEEVEGKTRRLLSVVDGCLKRSHNAQVQVQVESIPPLSLSQLKLFTSTLHNETTMDTGNEGREEGSDIIEEVKNEDDDYDALFSNAISFNTSDDFSFMNNSETNTSDGITFDQIDLTQSTFSTTLSDKLASILQYTSLPGVSDIEQVRLLAIAHTVARTSSNFSDSPMYSMSFSTDIGTTDLSTSSGAGYAAVGLTSGGGEAIDDCGMRYLLALQNYLALSISLPQDVAPLEVAMSDVIWAFHSDSETELLSNIPCVQEDRLNWPDLKSAGISLWVRSNDTLRKLAEKLAKAQFMAKQDPLDASLLYLAMKKQSLLKGLFKTVSDERMRKFFSNDFTQDRWRRAALKNAFSLLSKQRFDHAAAFFLLAGKLWDAIDVCISRLNDIKLALFITRLYEGDSGPCYERLLKECILGIGTSTHEPSKDPFLRSIALWLLQDFSGSLETLLVNLNPVVELSSIPDPSIFSFYFYLRSHPLLLRRKYPTKPSHRSIGGPSPSVSNFSLSYHSNITAGIGDDPFTPVERNLVFSTAYYHLNSGSPLLALIVLDKLPKNDDLGLFNEGSGLMETESSKIPANFSGKRTVSVAAIMSGLIGGGGQGKNEEEDIDWSQPVSFQALSSISEEKEDEEIDWSQPIASQIKQEDDDFDWSQPVSTQLMGGTQDEEFDWSQPVSSQLMSPEDTLTTSSLIEEQVSVSTIISKSVISHQGMFLLSLAEQLQYNALLSILTEELKWIHAPACCNYLWDSKGNEALPLLPINQSTGSHSIVEWFEEEPLERVLISLQSRLVTWLRQETLVVREVCGMELANSFKQRASHAGYDLLTTLMNYISLHAGTLPNMLAVQTELIHLMNTLLPWSTALSNELEDTDLEAGHAPSCAINPAQLPLLSACSLPAKHPLNMALHIRLMSASIFNSLSVHSSPPICTNPLNSIDSILELCCALSHCVHLCLSPMRLQQENVIKSSDSFTSPSQGRRRSTSGGPLLDMFSNLDTPNTKASKWPGLEDWPSSLLSDDGKEASPLCLVLMEALTVVYVGLLSVAWSTHSIYDILILIANVPTQSKWTELFGGGVTTKLPDQKKTASFVQRVSLVKKLLQQQASKSGHNVSGVIGLFIAPVKSLLNQFLTKPEVHTGTSQYNFEKEPEDEYRDDYDEEEDDIFTDYNPACNPTDPNCYSWCIMNLGIIQMLQKVLRNTISLTGMEMLEFITASPVLYRIMSLLEDWETFFAHQLNTYSSPPSLDVFLPTDSTNNNQSTSYGPALTRHKLILEPEHSPFRGEDKNSRLAKRLWCYLVHQETVRETFIRYVFYKKRVGSAVADEPPVQRILYRQPDSPVSCLCINSNNSSVFALATSKEVLEVEVPDIMSLDIMMDVDDNTGGDTPTSIRKSSGALKGAVSDEYIMIPSGTSHSLKRGSNFVSPGHVTYSQSGCTSSILLNRTVSAVKHMSAHPTLAYYLTGGADGSIRMFEFGTPKPVSVLRQAGSGPGITQIRFTPQGNKYGVTDYSGKLSLWQGIQGHNKEPYQTLTPAHTHQTIADFAFLGSSSLIATCGESSHNKNICIWDTMMPKGRNVVNEWVCHEGGASAIVFSNSKQRLISGGRRGEIYIYDLRSRAVVSKPVVHTGAVSCIVINDTDGYFITGCVDGEIKVWDLSTVTELTSIQGRHTKTRLFRADEGVMDMTVDASGCLYSCGADGTVKVHSLDLPNVN